MEAVRHIETLHEDLVHDVRFDFFGRRMATCASDQRIKVWDQDKDTGQWVCSAEWKAHSGSVWRVAWAHPSNGSVLASCSFDRSVNIWEEQEDNTGEKTWVRCVSLVDARDSVQDIEFGPPHAGLKLATASADGNVRVYEATDVTNLSQWPLLDDFESEKRGVLSLAWNPHPFERHMLAVASHNKEAPVKMWEYNEALRRWVHVASIAGHTDAVHDVAWAPFVGRSYHIIATASKDRTVRLWTLDRRDEAQQGDKQQAQGGQMVAQGSAKQSQQQAVANTLRIEQDACFEDHGAEVWRVSWNVTGTVLASSGDDGNVRLFRRSFATGNWELLQTMAGDAGTEDA